MSHFTPNQLRAIERNGNVLVLAGAGTGKTRTLVERCVARLLDPETPATLDQMLLVTFTEAAAAEMKRRIRGRLEEELVKTPVFRARLERELTLLERADICTLHSFCLRLVQNHFDELHLDPQTTVLSDVQRRLLMDDTLDALLRKYFANAGPRTTELQELLTVYGFSPEGSIHDLLFKLHDYVRTRPHSDAWVKEQVERFEVEEGVEWQTWFGETFQRWRERWLIALRAQPADNLRAHDLAQIVANTAEARTLLDTICAADEDWTNGGKIKYREPISAFFEEAEFLGSLIAGPGDWTPLREDWNWVRRPMLILLELLREFSAAFAERKRAESFLDFNDFEQFALQLLCSESGVTPLAIQYRHRFKWVMVDEYQDINPSQDAILRALSGDGPDANRFLVGDVKQSIYRFRLAQPRIFQSYKSQWSARGSVIALSDNFRSRARLLKFVNSTFSVLMRREVGGVSYDEDARLKFGDSPERQPLAEAAPAAEFHLILKEKHAPFPEDGEQDAAVEFTDAEREARIVANRLWELRESRFQVWNKETQAFAPATWRDMVILLRAPMDKAEIYARAFHQAGIPFQAQSGGFYDSTEILDLISLLQLLQNPLNDVPTIAVLRSPLVGLSLDELAEIRLAKKKEPFWIALKRWHEIGKTHPAFAKIDGFLRQFTRWRQWARESTISQRIERILEETHYLEWLLTQDRPAQRRANVERFLALAQQFDPLQRLGLHRFLRYIQAQRETDQQRDPQLVENPDIVRLMSIHQSKGLEFPVVVLPDLAKDFNTQDLAAPILIDDQLGLCPKIQPPGVNGKYPSLPHWMAVCRHRPEILGEEMRLLYVAFTRAQDRLILVGTTTPKRAHETWSARAAHAGEPEALLAAKSYLDWLGPMLSRSMSWAETPDGATELLCWHTHRGKSCLPSPPGARRVALEPGTETPEDLGRLIKKLEWRYSHQLATTLPAKQNATGISRMTQHKSADEAQQLFAFDPPDQPASGTRMLQKRGALSAADVGVAHHKFLHLMSFAAAKGREALIAEADRLEGANFLTCEERKALDLTAVLAFWQSTLGQKVLAHSRYAHREIPFTARCTISDLKNAGVLADSELDENDFLIVRGAVDLAIILEREIWLVDFKTDALAAAEVVTARGKHTPQLRLYAQALSRIYRRPVTESYLHFLALNRTERVVHQT